jgi:hypothetical protein
MNEEAGTVGAVAPDGSGRFAYLLMAGDFSRSEGDALRGIDRSWVLDRWDELKLRVFLHGESEPASRRNHA